MKKTVFFLVALILVACGVFWLFQFRPKSVVTTAVKEEFENLYLDCTGEVPSWLTGTLIRNGPIPFSINGKESADWFDGLAMLHAFCFQYGQITYTNRFLRTTAYEDVMEKGSIDGLQEMVIRGTRPISPWTRLIDWLSLDASEEEFLPNANMNICRYGNRPVALTESPIAVRFDRDTLETLGAFQYKDHIPDGIYWVCAHPNYDGIKQELFNYFIQYEKEPHYTVWKMGDGLSSREIIAKLSVPYVSFMPTFSLTPHFVVFLQSPFVIPAKGFYDKPIPEDTFANSLTWSPELGSVFLTIDRETGAATRQRPIKPLFCQHQINAFETPGALYVDCICYDKPFMVEKDLHQAKIPDSSRVERFALSLKTGVTTSKVLFSAPVEFPCINPKYNSQPYRYAYMVNVSDALVTRPLYKLDLSTQQVITWSEENCQPGEPLFVAAPAFESQELAEDDGVLLVLVAEVKKNYSFLLILNASDLKELGRATLPYRIPDGLHGAYFSDN